MTLSERRNQLLTMLKNADDLLISKLELVVANHIKGTSGSVEELPEDIQAMLTRSLDDIRNGEVRSHENVMSDFREKYGKPKKK
ncbi:hypothetical protein [Phaeocystidibacter luteus]|uniref:Addiction module protein n=1 Tax=Phaeocystidibacter luteus TaxID=911197 RepID=A0A6N6RL52_9FLAO|nr:hypothetical protein [Phaeocystidibacter luteus]KAB2813642.1 hypothetical protein F8C67_05625 [Phaeocystidibacter luteus]